MNEEQFDSFLKQNIGRNNECCPSDAFVNNVMSNCCKVGIKEKFSFAKYKIYALSLIPILLILCMIFIPGLNGILLTIFSKISLSKIMIYYTSFSLIILISFYAILTEKIVKFIKRPLPVQ